ncbi:MAG: helix-turn-helix domain-containing protein [Candidatus Omnitrophota bacterium]
MSGISTSTGIKGILKTIGAKFREAREEKGLSIEQVQKETHFHHNVIEILEEGSGDDKLGKLYLKSYLKKYCLYLGMNADDALGEFTNYQTPATHQNIEIKRVDKLNDVDQALKTYLPRVAAAIVAAALAVGLLFAVVKGISAIGRRIASVKRSAPSGGKPAESKPEKRPPRARTSAPKINRSDNFIPVSIPKNESLRLAIDVNQPVLLMAARDGEILFTNVLRAGTRETVIAEKKITLWVKEASSIELTLNADYLGSPGKGEIKSLEITRDGVKITK